MKSYILEGIRSPDEARTALGNILPGQKEPWLLTDPTGDPVAYFNVCEGDVESEGSASGGR